MEIPKNVCHGNIASKKRISPFPSISQTKQVGPSSLSMKILICVKLRSLTAQVLTSIIILNSSNLVLKFRIMVSLHQIHQEED